MSLQFGGMQRLKKATYVMMNGKKITLPYMVTHLEKHYPNVASKRNIVSSWVKLYPARFFFSFSKKLKKKKKSVNCVKFLAYMPMSCKISEQVFRKPLLNHYLLCEDLPKCRPCSLLTELLGIFFKCVLIESAIIIMSLSNSY